MALPTPRPGWRWWLLAVLLGLPFGIGAFTFHYAHGSSYLSANPKACVNCHIMQAPYDAWQKSSHHAVATCVDCHLPGGFFEKWFAKALNGWNHSKAFTLQDFPEPIRITPRNASILQSNCLRCHDAMVHDLVSGATTDPDSIPCVHCHRSAGHGDPVGLGGPETPSERSAR